MENNNKIIPKPDLKLRKIGNRYMIVDVSENCANLTDVYSLNETAAWLWNAICQGSGNTVDELAGALCEVYNVEKERALRDVEAQVEDWEKMGIIKV